MALFDLGKALQGLDQAQQKALYKTEIYGRSVAPKLEKKAKEDAPWTDRTGHARGTMTSDAAWRGDTLQLRLMGNMSYSVYLEFAHGKNGPFCGPRSSA